MVNGAGFIFKDSRNENQIQVFTTILSGKGFELTLQENKSF
jgi:hypothetical protein